jgi:drug/metabolite transporter (DMT)-like permease
MKSTGRDIPGTISGPSAAVAAPAQGGGTPHHMGLREWLLLIILAAIWGTSFLVIKVALTALPSFTIVMLRVSIAACGLYLAARIFRISFTVPKGVKTASVVGAFALLGLMNNSVPFTLLVWGQSHISVTLASILNATMPLFTVFFAHFFAPDERLSPRKLLGVAVGFIGVVVVILPTAMGAVSGSFWGQVAMLGAACSYGFSVVMARRFNRFGLHPIHIAWGQMVVATMIMVPAALLIDKPWLLAMPGADVWGAVLILALFCSALAYVLYFQLLKTAGATNASVVTLLVPVFAILMGVGLLGEIFAPEQAFGLAAIAVGLLILDGRIYVYLRKRLART